MSELAELIMELYVEQRAVFAQQTPDGNYHPVRRELTLHDVDEHLAGRRTYGAYVVADTTARVLTFDLDLTTAGTYLDFDEDLHSVVRSVNPREAWRDPNHPTVPHLTHCLRFVARALADKITELTDVTTVTSYSGSKGLHVDAFTGPQPAGELREIAQEVLNSFETPMGPAFVQGSTAHFLRPVCTPNLEVEVFPKQSDTRGGTGYPVRLPLGRNLKGGRAFFVDTDESLLELVEAEPLSILRSVSVFK